MIHCHKTHSHAITQLPTNTRRCPARVLFATLPQQGGFVLVAQNANGEPWAILPPTQVITALTASSGLGAEDPGPPVARRDTKEGRVAHPTSALHHELGETRVNFYRLGVHKP